MPHDWEERYRIESTPWDLGRAHPELEARLGSGELAPPREGARALVPGCGRGWDAGALAKAGWSVTAIDLVAALEAVVAPRVAAHGGRFVAGDALEFDAEEVFDLVWEHTCFCAIDPEERARYGAMVRRVLGRGGWFAALEFPVGKARELGGPPFGVAVGDYQLALGDGFRLASEGGVGRRVARREFEERFALFERMA